MATTTTTTKYGASVSLSVEKGVRSKYKRRFGLAYPLAQINTIIPTTYLQNNKGGSVTFFGKASGIKLIKNNLTQLIKTEKGERIMLPNYGLGLQKYLFEPLDETMYELLKYDILSNLENYFSIGRVIYLGIYSEEQRKEQNQLVIRLTLQLLDESLDIFDIEAKVG
jgi:phage baseplate assembly protein W